MGLTEFLATYITAFIEKTGYVSVFILMTMESMIFPIPSEAVMPFAGFNIAAGKFTWWGVLVASTLGSIAGSFISYYIGAYGGKPFINKFGKYFLLDKDDLTFTERFFARFGEITIFICRFIPIVRHLISLPAGIARMNIVRFGIFTIIGATMWNMFLAWAGFTLKKNWELVMRYSKVVDIVVIVVLMAAVAYFVYRHLAKHRRGKSNAKRKR
ncbi:MAG: DedA family protein [Spirochaetota bacterium]